METRAVEQAYLQAKMEGLPVYIMLPTELWTDDMWHMRCPVFRLERALYGHKHSGELSFPYSPSLVGFPKSSFSFIQNLFM